MIGIYEYFGVYLGMKQTLTALFLLMTFSALSAQTNQETLNNYRSSAAISTTAFALAVPAVIYATKTPDQSKPVRNGVAGLLLITGVGYGVNALVQRKKWENERFSPVVEGGQVGFCIKF